MKLNYKNIVEYGLKNGADDVEIFIRKRIIKTLALETDRYKGSMKREIDSVVRVALGKKVASHYLTIADEESLKKAVNRAIKMAKAVGEDPFWSGLPSYREPNIKSLFYDKRIDNLTYENMFDILKEVRDHAFKIDDRIKGVLSEINIIKQNVDFINSNGIEYHEELSGQVFEVAVTSKEGDKYTSIWTTKRTRRFFEDYIKYVDETARKSLRFLNTKHLDNIVKKVLIDPISFSALIFHSLTYGISGDYVLEGISPLKDKLGEVIASDELSIYDDGTLPGGWKTSIFDDEGVPRRKTIVLERGELRSFLHNYYTALRMNLESTGNAERIGTNVTTRISNLIIEEGSEDICSIINDIDEGVYLSGFPLSAHTINISTGDVNVVFPEAYLISKGEIKYPLNPVTLSGNIYEALKDIMPLKGITDTPYSIYTPPVYTERFTVK